MTHGGTHQFYVKLSDPSCIGFCEIVRKKSDRQTDRQTPVKALSPLLLWAWVTYFDFISLKLW